ncbi:MAG: hypothetical protein ACE5K0_04255 [Candidatus Methanofastidiosia archaeon]
MHTLNDPFYKRRFERIMEKIIDGVESDILNEVEPDINDEEKEKINREIERKIEENCRKHKSKYNDFSAEIETDIEKDKIYLNINFGNLITIFGPVSFGHKREYEVTYKIFKEIERINAITEIYSSDVSAKSTGVIFKFFKYLDKILQVFANIITMLLLIVVYSESGIQKNAILITLLIIFFAMVFLFVWYLVSYLIKNLLLNFEPIS